MVLAVLIEGVVVTVRVLLYVVAAMLKCFLPAKKKSVNGKIILITGGASGIGRLMSLKFASLGAVIVIWDVDTKGLQNIQAEIKNSGGSAHVYTVDITKKDKVYETAALVQRDVGDVSILVNNAGIVSVKAFLPKMIEKNEGHLVTIASTAGLIGVNRLVDYCASKYGAVGFHEALRAEFVASKKKINTTVICPFFITTGMFEGCKTRFPSVLPLLKPDYVCNSIVNAVLTNERHVVLPPISAFFMFLKNALPIDAVDLLNDFFGAYSYMNEFVGRTPLEKKTS